MANAKPVDMQGSKKVAITKPVATEDSPKKISSWTEMMNDEGKKMRGSFQMEDGTIVTNS